MAFSLLALKPRQQPLSRLRFCQCPFGDRMSEHQDSTSKSSSSSISSSTQESEEEVTVTIGSLLAQAKNNSGNSLGRRLSQLGSIPHTPRVNGKIPNLDNATLDHERLSERLGNYGLAEFQIEGDGNCQFGAKICLLTSFRDTCLIEIVPRDVTPTRDFLTRKTKKKHWLF
uniref:OTU domain-containing protein n=1 Tax=Leersia perrieri TaxID=77586 RepID=A0A0D9WT41_9ORYZ